MTAQLTVERLFFDLSSRVKLRVTGADRVRFLNGQITNDVRKASQQQIIEACVLTSKGKMEAHIFVHADGDSFVIDADSSLASTLQTRLERYVIADDVQIHDITGQFIFHVTGLAPKLSIPAHVLAVDRFGISGTDIWCDHDSSGQIASELNKAHKFCGEDCAEQLRIEQGLPRWGRELTPEIIPVEANLEQRCIDYDKGCYIGQETISRMKMSGQRNKQLCGLIALSGEPFVRGMRLIAGPENKDAGWITSAAEIRGRQIALGYVKRGFNSAGTELDAMLSGEEGRVAARVVGLPFSN